MLHEAVRACVVVAAVLAVVALLLWGADFVDPWLHPFVVVVTISLVPCYLIWLPFRALRRQEAALLIDEGTQRLQSGDPAMAELALDAAARKDSGELRAVAVYHLSLAKLHQGELESARQMFEVVDASLLLLRRPLLHEAILDRLALCLALQGRIPETKAMLVRSAERRHHTSGALGVLPEAIMLARVGSLGAAANLLESRWREVEGPGGMYTKAARLVRALVLEEMGGEQNRSVAAGELNAARPVSATDVRALCASWPEMERFLREKGF